MSTPSIQLTGDGNYRPGSVVDGRVQGFGMTGEVRLFWNTCGRGTDEVGVVDRQRVGGDGAFRLSLPLSPYTTHGTLISIAWGIEWVDESGDAVDYREIIVSPTLEAVRLEKVEKPKSEKAKSRWMPTS
jgi:hypothetical protein